MNGQGRKAKFGPGRRVAGGDSQGARIKLRGRGALQLVVGKFLAGRRIGGQQESVPFRPVNIQVIGVEGFLRLGAAAQETAIPLGTAGSSCRRFFNLG